MRRDSGYHEIMPASPAAAEHFNSPVLSFARQDFSLLEQGLTVGAALEVIRRQGIGERLIYFYVVDERGRLSGVLPTRRLLSSALETPLTEIMVPRVVAIPMTATVLEACEFFVLHKFFAFPVVDAERRPVGVVDVGMFTEELLEADEDEDQRTAGAAAGGGTLLPVAPPGDEVFEALGFRLAQLKGASPLRAFRFRFPWLLATIASGTICALLSGAFEATLAGSLVIAFFLTMVLGLNESVSIQSMTVTIQALRNASPSRRWFFDALRREGPTALLIGASCGATVALIVWLWRGELRAAVVIGGSIALSLLTACLFGLSVPSLLHHWKLDPKIAAGPITLALADVCALLLYFSAARLLL